MISPAAPKGLVVNGLVGPKMTRVGVLTAAPICAGPVSLVIKRSPTLMIAAASATVVFPVKTIGCLRMFCRTR